MRALRLSVKEQGLTLVELLVSTAILGLVAASVPVLMDTGFAGLARQRDSVHRELTYGVLFEEWALDVAGAQTGMGITDGVVLTQSEGEVRYLVKGAEVYREMRKTGVVAWKSRPHATARLSRSGDHPDLSGVRRFGGNRRPGSGTAAACGGDLSERRTVNCRGSALMLALLVLTLLTTLVIAALELSTLVEDSTFQRHRATRIALPRAGGTGGGGRGRLLGQCGLDDGLEPALAGNRFRGRIHEGGGDPVGDGSGGGDRLSGGSTPTPSESASRWRGIRPVRSQ